MGTQPGGNDSEALMWKNSAGAPTMPSPSTGCSSGWWTCYKAQPDPSHLPGAELDRYLPHALCSKD